MRRRSFFYVLFGGFAAVLGKPRFDVAKVTLTHHRDAFVATYIGIGGFSCRSSFLSDFLTEDNGDFEEWKPSGERWT